MAKSAAQLLYGPVLVPTTSRPGVRVLRIMVVCQFDSLAVHARGLTQVLTGASTWSDRNRAALGA